MLKLAFLARIGVKNAILGEVLPESTGGERANGAQQLPHISIPVLAPHNANKNSKSIRTNIHTTNTINNNKGTICYSESSCNFR